MLVRRTRRIDIECVVRGYLAGSAWADYRQSGEQRSACGVALPAGLVESARAARADLHPDHQGGAPATTNRSASPRLIMLVGAEMAERNCAPPAWPIYREAAAYARDRAASSSPTPSWSLAGWTTS